MSDSLPFTVVAGRFEPDGEENAKYIESFSNLDDAIAAAITANDYPFCRIEYQTPNGVFFLRVWRED